VLAGATPHGLSKISGALSRGQRPMCLHIQDIVAYRLKIPTYSSSNGKITGSYAIMEILTGVVLAENNQIPWRKLRTGQRILLWKMLFPIFCPPVVWHPPATQDKIKGTRLPLDPPNKPKQLLVPAPERFGGSEQTSCLRRPIPRLSRNGQPAGRTLSKPFRFSKMPVLGGGSGAGSAGEW
jgi:hypothetical protein